MTWPPSNAYWVLTGRVLAGEYPGARDAAAARAKVRAHLEAGIRTFVDLTEAGELVPYDSLLADEAARLGVTAEHLRLPIRDRDIPASPARMVKILDVLDRATPERPAYVHCWGGIGRTGTVVGCFLRRHGLTGEDALMEVARLFATTEKAPFRHSSPETQPQADYVREWMG